MGTSAVQYRILPKGVETNLDDLKKSIESTITKMGGVPHMIEEHPIAFGLKALVVSFAYPEESEIDELGNILSDLGEVSSLELIDYRRAVG